MFPLSHYWVGGLLTPRLSPECLGDFEVDLMNQPSLFLLLPQTVECVAVHSLLTLYLRKSGQTLVLVWPLRWTPFPVTFFFFGGGGYLSVCPVWGG